MPKIFEDGKRYKFSKNIFLTNTVNSTLYQNSSSWRTWVNEMDNKEVTILNYKRAYIGKSEISPTWCDEIMPSTFKTVMQVCKELYREPRTPNLDEFIEWQKEKPQTRSVEIKINSRGIEAWVFDRDIVTGQFVKSVSEIDIYAAKERRDREQYEALKKKYEDSSHERN